MELARIALAGLAVAGLWGCQPRDGKEAEIAAAVRDNDVAAVRQYLESGGDPDAVSRDGAPLIYLATGPRGGVEVLAVLIASGADLEQTAENARTPLMNAAGWCDAQMVEMLLEAGANAAYTTPGGDTIRGAVCAGPLDRRAAVLNLLDGAR